MCAYFDKLLPTEPVSPSDVQRTWLSVYSLELFSVLNKGPNCELLVALTSLNFCVHKEYCMETF